MNVYQITTNTKDVGKNQFKDLYVDHPNYCSEFEMLLFQFIKPSTKSTALQVINDSYYKMEYPQKNDLIGTIKYRRYKSHVEFCSRNFDDCVKLLLKLEWVKIIPLEDRIPDFKAKEKEFDGILLMRKDGTFDLPLSMFNKTVLVPASKLDSVKHLDYDNSGLNEWLQDWNGKFVRAIESPKSFKPNQMELPTPIYAWLMDVIKQYRVSKGLDSKVAGTKPTKRAMKKDDEPKTDEDEDEDGQVIEIEKSKQNKKKKKNKNTFTIVSATASTTWTTTTTTPSPSP